MNGYAGRNEYNKENTLGKVTRKPLCDYAKLHKVCTQHPLT